MTRVVAILAGAALALWSATALAQPGSQPPPATPPPAPVQGDFVIRDFRFADGESLPQVKIHYYAFGTPHRNAAGHVDNAVLIMHGTGGTGHSLIRPEFAGELIGPGQLLDAARFYLIFPDDLGHGQSSKPSDGLHARFPHYGYADMVEAEHRLVTEGLKVDHLRLVMGTSMGCMHTFMWGENWPGMMDALMPLACNTIQIAGRNRVWRDMIVQAIKNDPAWKGGDYTEEPTQSLTTAAYIQAIAGSAPHQMQKALPTRDDADAYVTRVTAAYLKDMDANDTLYQVDSSRDYDPSARLGEITAPVMWVNSADDFINPPELGIAEQEVKQIRRGQFVLLPIGPNTHGHGTHTFAVAWKQYLAQLLQEFRRVSSLLVSSAIFGAWGVSWLLASVWSRRTAARLPGIARAPDLALTIAGAMLIAYSSRLRVTFGVGPFGWRSPPAIDWTLTGLVALGLAFTWWARLTLGDLWSSAVTRKEAHVVVNSGPYHLVRHPIYTGLIFALLALAFQVGRPTAPLGALLLATGFWAKARQEERFLSVELGAAYADFRRTTPMLIPFWPVRG